MGWNRSKPCEIPPYYQQIRCINQAQMYKIPLEWWKSWERGRGGRLVQWREKGVSEVGAARVGWAPISDCVCEEVRARQRQAQTCGGMKMEEWSGSHWWREPLQVVPKDMPGVTLLWPWVPPMCVYLPKCHGNSVLITWKYLKYVFSFHNSSLKNQRIEW